MEQYQLRERAPRAAPITPEPLPPPVNDTAGQPASVIRITTRMTLNNQACYFNMDYAQTAPGQTPVSAPVARASLQALCDAYNVNIVTNWLPLAGVNLHALDMVCTQISARTIAAQIITPAGWPNAGFQISEMLPQNSAIVMSKYTGHRGRRGRGRMYWPGLITDNVTAGMVTDEALATMNTQIRDKITIGFSLPPLQWHAYVTIGHVMKTGAAPPNDFEVGVRGSIITSCKFQQDVRTQRRRNIGRGI